MTKQQVIDLLQQQGLNYQDAETMASIAQAESNLNPNAVYVTPKEYSVGLFQINEYAWGDYLHQVTGSNDRQVWTQWLQNPVNNVKAAIHVLNSNQGLNAWTTYTSGKYKQFEGAAATSNEGTNDQGAGGLNVLGINLTGGWKTNLVLVVVGVFLLVIGIFSMVKGAKPA